MIDVVLNGKPHRVAAGATVEDAVRLLGVEGGAGGVAVAVNEAVVPKRDWGSRRLSAGDVIEVIRAVQGG